jgi:hypothetical protein
MLLPNRIIMAVVASQSIFGWNVNNRGVADFDFDCPQQRID